MNFSKEGGIESGSLEADADLLLLLVEGLGGHDHDVGLLLDGVSLREREEGSKRVKKGQKRSKGPKSI